MSGSAIILVDGGYYGYIDSYADAEYGSKLDLYNLSLHLCDYFDVKLLRTKYYNALPYVDDDDPTEEQEDQRSRAQSFFDTVDGLRKCQFEQKGRVKLDHENCPSCGTYFRSPSQKGVDVGIAVDIVEMACDMNAPDAFILISGDEDLKHAVSAAKDNHANVYLAHAFNTDHDLYSAEALRQEADHMVNLAGDFITDEMLQ